MAIGTILCNAKLLNSTEVSGEAEPVLRPPWSSILLLDLFGKHRYHAASRFILYKWGSKLPRLLLMVVNWEVYSWVNLEAQVAPACQLSHSVYVKYLEVTQGSLSPLVEAWAQDEGVIPLQYPESYLFEIMAKIVKLDAGSALHPMVDGFKDGSIRLTVSDPITFAMRSNHQLDEHFSYDPMLQ